MPFPHHSFRPLPALLLPMVVIMTFFAFESQAISVKQATEDDDTITMRISTIQGPHMTYVRSLEKMAQYIKKTAKDRLKWFC